MEIAQLKVKTRPEVGRSRLRAVRRAGLLPGVVYGPDVEPRAVSLSLHDFKMLLQRGVSFHNPIEMEIEGEKGSGAHVLIRDVHYDKVWGEVVHVDFYRIPKGRPIQVQVPIKIIGVPIGVADGGVMQWPARKLRVECLPDRIPAAVEVEVSGLAKGHSLHVSDLVFPDGVKSAEKSNLTVVSVLVPKEEEIKKPEEVAAVATAEGAAPAAAGEGEAGTAVPPAKGGKPAAAGKPEAAATGKAAPAEAASKGGQPATAGKSAPPAKAGKAAKAGRGK